MSFEHRKLIHLKKSLESLTIKYDMFFSNRQYKSVHFKSEEEYLIIQKNLSTEIEIEEKNVKNLLKEWFNLNFDNIKFIEYDSRFICMNAYTHRIGKVLIKNSQDLNIQKKIKEKFNDDTDFEMIIETFEDLPEDVQKKFTK